MEFEAWIDPVRDFLSFPIITFGEARLTLWTVFYLSIFLFLLFYFTGKLRSWIIERVLARSKVHIGVRQAIGTILRYVIIVLGFLVIAQTAGIDLTTLNVLAGAAPRSAFSQQL